MPSNSDVAATTRSDETVAAVAVRRLYLLMSLPIVGFVLFGIGGVLAMRAFAHNNSLQCSDVATVGSFGAPGSCSHYSYLLPAVLGVGGILLLLAGGFAASYYAARTVGVPALAALRRRSRPIST